MTRRSLTPLDAAALNIPSGAQSINLANEHFLIRVPGTRPAGGFGILVFIPPWDDARSLERWGPVLDHFGLIFVSAIRSGNERSTLGRREPLAVLAAYNIARLYPVDPERVFIGGFSGGSRVAMRVALAYPDIFRGALLDAGSDPIGSRAVPLPPRDLFDRFRRESRLSYVTGALDEASLQLDADSLASMQRWCMFNTHARRIPDFGHDLVSAAPLATAFSELIQPASETSSSQTCWSRMLSVLDAKLDGAERTLSSDPIKARDQLTKIDHRYGGLAARRVVTLMRETDPKPR